MTTVTFLFLLLSVIDLAQFLFIHQSLAERVRFATRSGGVQILNATAITNIVLYGKSTIASGTTPKPFFGLKSSQVEVAITGQNTNAARVRVKISGYNFATVTPFFKGLAGIPVQVTMPLEVP
ncbi:MAG TPA: hypothetical protein DEH78_10320 [Solibacterales bacterium]|nr:hypothetical protein [Bryobacterales bacterium]